MYSNKSPPTVPAGMESPYISIPARCGIAPSTGMSLSRKYASIPESREDVVIEPFSSQGVRSSSITATHRSLGWGVLAQRLLGVITPHRDKFNLHCALVIGRAADRSPSLASTDADPSHLSFLRFRGKRSSRRLHLWSQW